MSFSAYTDLPRLRNYAAAVEHYNSIVPIRGSDNVRPICRTENGRRKRHMLIHESTVLGCKAISCELFETDVLSFLEDGRVHIDNRYASMSTNSFINEILLGVARAFIHAGRTWLSSYNDQHWVMGKEMVLLPRVSGWVPETPVKAYRALLDRRASNAALKPYEPFIAHCKNVAKLVDAETVKDSFRIGGGIRLRQALNLSLATIANPDRVGWSDMTMVTLRNGVSSSYNYRMGRFQETLDGERAVKWLRRTLQEAHMHEVFRLEEIPLGEMARDENYKITSLLMRYKRCD